MSELLSVVPEQSARFVVQEFPEEGRGIQLLTQGDQQAIDQIFTHAQGLGRQYLPWEAVRNGLGAEIVGNTYVNGKNVPLTGFEGYFVRPGGVSAEAVIRQEAAVGKHFADIAVRIPGGYGILKDPERIGLGMVDAEVIKELYAEFGATLARLRGDLITAYMGGLTEFQQATRQKVEQLPSMKLRLVDGKLVDEHSLPSLPSKDVYDRTNIVVSKEHERGLLLLAEIGRLGHPATRSYWSFKSRHGHF